MGDAMGHLRLVLFEAAKRWDEEKNPWPSFATLCLLGQWWNVELAGSPVKVTRRSQHLRPWLCGEEWDEGAMAPAPEALINERLDAERFIRRASRDARDAAIIRRHYVAGESLGEIASSLGVSRERACQLHAGFLQRARAVA